MRGHHCRCTADSTRSTVSIELRVAFGTGFHHGRIILRIFGSLSFSDFVLLPVLFQHVQAVRIGNVLAANTVSAKVRPSSPFFGILRQLVKPFCMSPTLPESSIGQRHQCADSQHLRISMRFVPGHIDECADAGVVVMDKVSDRSYQCRSHGM